MNIIALIFCAQAFAGIDSIRPSDGGALTPVTVAVSSQITITSPQNGSVDALSGGLFINNSANDGMGLQIYTTRQGPSNQLSGLLYLRSTTTSYDEPMIYIKSTSTGTTGANADIRIDANNPDIEFVDTARNGSVGEGKFEIDARLDRLRFNIRDRPGNSTFVNWWYFDGPSASFVGVAGASITLGGSGAVPFSSAPVSCLSGSTLAGTLGSGTTFFATQLPSAITLRRITFTVAVAGVGGAGDTMRCNDVSNNGIQVVSGAAAAAGTVTTATGTGNIAVETQISCHVESAATTRPLGTVLLCYTMQ